MDAHDPSKFDGAGSNPAEGAKFQCWEKLHTSKGNYYLLVQIQSPGFLFLCTCKPIANDGEITIY